MCGSHAPSGSEHSRDDGEGHGGAAGLQLQGSQEALGGRCVVALSLQDLPQPVPHLVGRGVDLHGVSKDLLGQAVAAQLMEDQGLWVVEDTDRQTDRLESGFLQFLGFPGSKGVGVVQVCCMSTGLGT